MTLPTNAVRARWSAQLTRDKADTLLLLLSAACVLAPHAMHLPLWATLVCAVTLIWRGLITFRGSRMPPIGLLLAVAIVAAIGVFKTYHTVLGKDAGVTMLVLMMAFKTLEMHAKRDLFVVIFLGLFMVMTNFLYSQSIGTALLMLVSVMALLTAQLSFQYTGAVPTLARRARMAMAIMAGAAPIALLLFFIFPRINAPLWSMPGDAHSSRSGLSDSMAPGTVSSLAMSDETAFRVKFQGPAPSQEKLYWRGIVLGQFDGSTWRRVAQRPRGVGQHGETVALTRRGAPVGYQITQEASGAPWLFVLEMPQNLPAVTGMRIKMSPELEFASTAPIEARLRYALLAYPDYALQADAIDPHQDWLALPEQLNPRTRALARSLSAQGDPVKTINAVLARIRNDGYAYTLEPPLLPGPDSIDQFLFDSKAGFCEHYAGAFVFLMRAAGIPARVVTGYQGGELNPVDGVYTISQSDAHAWAEVWLAARGWVRVDPTAAVAPERIRHNLVRAIPRKAPFGMEGFGTLINLASDRNSWLGRLRFHIAAINNGWNQWVLNYTPERQRNFLAAASDMLSWRAVGLLGLAGALATLMLRLRARRHVDPVDALYLALCRHMARHARARAPDEGPASYAMRLDALALPAPRKAALAQFLAAYGDRKYGRPDARALPLSTFRKLFKRTR